MSLKTIALSAVLAVAALPAAALADTFTVSPTNLQVKGASAAEVTVRSGGPGAMQGQVRVMRWNPAGGADDLAPTRDVVASPAALRLGANQETTIRLVRVRKQAVGRTPECYRVLIDQLPGAGSGAPVVKFTIRHSVPLCFVQG